ncbi:MAG: hypothetical protein K0R84_2117, partial [Clostridia bacterium]|nr:hypothetical protein [Clostridia bacterium]
KEADIIASSTFPQSQLYRTPGEVITLSCKAPAGSRVTVKIGGQSYEMKPSGAVTNTKELYADTYKYDYTIPSFQGTPRNVDLGEPVYTMEYKGITKSAKAPAKVGAIMKNSPFYARIEKAVAYTYQTTNTSNGASYELYRGMVDYVTGMTGSFIRLSSGQWISKSDVMVYEEKAPIQPVVKSASYIVGEKWDSLKFDISSPAAAIASFDGKMLKLNISIASTSILPVLPQNSLFSAVKADKGDGKTQYTLTLKDNQRIEGYYVELTSTGIVLHVKRPVKAANGEKPLTGITIMLDPGHGGSDPGATGPWGWRYLEKAINFNMSTKLKAELESLGATVLMTRTTDVAVSLDERLTASRNVKPDLFISVHANSMNDNVDISKVDGFSAFYREELSIRGTWAPSVLIESGFVPNPEEFEWLISSEEQLKLAKTISEAVVKYFQQ